MAETGSDIALDFTVLGCYPGYRVNGAETSTRGLAYLAADMCLGYGFWTDRGDGVLVPVEHRDRYFMGF